MTECLEFWYREGTDDNSEEETEDDGEEETEDET